MINISWNKNNINVGEKEVELDYDILEVKELEDIVLVVTTPKDKVLDNLFGISPITGEVWQVQKLAEVYPEFSQTPYVGISIIDDKVIATDFCGCRFIIDPANGEVAGRTSASK